MDLSVSKEFANHFSLVAGVKNVFNVTSVNQTISGGATHGSGGSFAVGYGRSFFVRHVMCFRSKWLTNAFDPLFVANQNKTNMRSIKQYD